MELEIHVYTLETALQARLVKLGEYGWNTEYNQFKYIIGAWAASGFRVLAFPEYARVYIHLV